MKKNNVIATALALAIGTTMLTACNNEAEVTNEEDQTNLFTDLYMGVNEGDVYTFEPYEQLFFIRYSEEGVKARDTKGGSVEIPDGYEVVAVEQFFEPVYNSPQTRGYDVWYTNNQTVEVKAIYNEAYGRYDFSQFGKVKENEYKSVSSQKVIKY